MIEIVVGDITQLEVDVVVNAANSTLLGGGGVDGAIHRAAGPELLAYCRTLGGCPPGELRLSPGYGLLASRIMHVVGPVWFDGTRGEPEVLRRCYDGALQLGYEQALRTIAFPAISTGAFGYPIREATVIAIEVMRNYEARYTSTIACCFSPPDAAVYREVLRAPPSLSKQR